MTATNIDQAMNWFLTNTFGTLRCQGADGQTIEADCFPDAKAFFEAHGEQ